LSAPLKSCTSIEERKAYRNLMRCSSIGTEPSAASVSLKRSSASAH
jgi:hypothetical protein